ncbi:hypothetical protein [Delftia lacustris]|uniref:Spore coat polysaccharide biosynthesis protein SpsG, predicted glycosyltransferase n=1 Tax=Delftia lacustris TaxID=558537 RepID=A0A1H3F9I4_9BURK|nr:hypothetical protein [Delftia lacustris]SDX87703.1 Spore coat polysaccharide biosynthesis protein SpsG, predicted glycosyltransferase [Delftia lacustris]
MSFRVIFRCDGNAETGLGHLSRCINLARNMQLEDRKIQIFFWGDYDRFARQLLIRYGLSLLPFEPPPGNERGVDATLKVCVNFDMLLLDSYTIDQKYIDGLKQQPCKLALFDDDQRLDLRQADLVICFRANAELLDYGARHQLLGPSFLPVKPELRLLRERNLNLHPERLPLRILVFMSGGALGMKYLSSILDVLASSGRKISYLSKNAAPSYIGYNANHLSLTADMETVYAEADFVVCGGGLTKYECAFSGLVNACISLTNLQSNDTEEMARQGLTLDLGAAIDFEYGRVKREIMEFIDDPIALLGQRKNFASKISDDGSSKIVRTILSL